MDFVKTYFPGLHIHASTQMTITGVESAKLFTESRGNPCGDCEGAVTGRN